MDPLDKGAIFWQGSNLGGQPVYGGIAAMNHPSRMISNRWTTASALIHDLHDLRCPGSLMYRSCMIYTLLARFKSNHPVIDPAPTSWGRGLVILPHDVTTSSLAACFFFFFARDLHSCPPLLQDSAIIAWFMKKVTQGPEYR